MKKHHQTTPVLGEDRTQQKAAYHAPVLEKYGDIVRDTKGPGFGGFDGIAQDDGSFVIS